MYSFKKLSFSLLAIIMLHLKGGGEEERSRKGGGERKRGVEREGERDV